MAATLDQTTLKVDAADRTLPSLAGISNDPPDLLRNRQIEHIVNK
jgi:hypothetical protein